MAEQDKEYTQAVWDAAPVELRQKWVEQLVIRGAVGKVMRNVVPGFQKNLRDKLLESGCLPEDVGDKEQEVYEFLYGQFDLFPSVSIVKQLVRKEGLVEQPFEIAMQGAREILDTKVTTRRNIGLE